MQTFQKKTNMIFYQITMIIVVFAIVFFYSASSLYNQVVLILTAASSKLESICGCANHFSFSSHPYLFTSILILGFALTIYFGYILYKFIKLKNSTNKYIKENLKKRNYNISQKLKDVAWQAGLASRFIEIKTKKPIVFCFSFFSPKICISSELVKKLGREELLAVLLHEKMHINNMEPIKMFLVKSAEKILFFLPGFKSLAKQYFIYSEMAADELATGGFKNKTPLAGALCKVMDLEKNLLSNNNLLAVSFFNITDERINKLIDSNYKPKFRFNSVKLAIDFFVLFLIAFSFFQINNFDLALSKVHTAETCLHQQNMRVDSCEISKENLTCKMEEKSATVNYFDRCHDERYVDNSFNFLEL
jgi:beta-lactamase regulating signal transducer with metallopeptidase domain